MTTTLRKSDLEELLNQRVLYDTMLAPYTTWRIGGPAEILAFPRDPQEVKNAILWAQNEKVKVTVLGGGSNVLVKDGGIRGLVLYLARGLKGIRIAEDTLSAGAGNSWASVIKKALAAGWGGLEFGAGIPGTLGGAIRGNAGAFGTAIGDLVESLSTIDLAGREGTLFRKNLRFQYRSSNLTKDTIILEAKLKLKPDNPSAIEERCRKFFAERKKRQPLGSPSAGSVFKNPPGHAAGKLIEEAGLKGKSVGGAVVSGKHANFIINKGGAKAEEVLALINLIQDKIYRQFSLVLEPEIVILG